MPRRDRSSLLLFHKVHCGGAVSIEKDKYLTRAHSLKYTRASHDAQYCRYQTYSNALNKYSFFPDLFNSVIPQLNSFSPGGGGGVWYSLFIKN